MERQVEKYLQALVHGTRAVLGDRLVGVYAGGSLALDEFVTGRSDIDVAVVTGNELDEPMKEALADRLRHESIACPARGLELVVYRQALEARDGGPPPDRMEAQGFQLRVLHELTAGVSRDEPWR